MDRSLIWSALGRMSKQGLLPIPIEDISASLTSVMNNNNVWAYYYIDRYRCGRYAAVGNDLSSVSSYYKNVTHRMQYNSHRYNITLITQSSGTYLCFVALVSTASWTAHRSTTVWYPRTWTPTCTCRPACVSGTIFRISYCCRRLWQWTRCHWFLYCSCTRTSPDSVTVKRNLIK